MKVVAGQPRLLSVCFNLANVLYALGQKEQAVERYCQALELDNHFAKAWNNLGNALAPTWGDRKTPFERSKER